METPIITEYGHQYVYSDVLHYFLYVPEKMKIAMRGSGHNVVADTKSLFPCKESSRSVLPG